MQSFYKWCPITSYNNGGRRSDRDGFVEFNNGSRIDFFHLENPRRYRVLQGLELNFAFFDQAEELEERAFTTCMARLSRWDQAKVPQQVIDAYKATGIEWKWFNPGTGEPLVPPYMFLTCNPDNEEHWLWRRFHPDSPVWQEKYKEMGYRFVQMPSWENKFASKENLKELSSNDPSWVARYRDGLWGYPSGVIHDVNPLSLLSTDRQDDRGTYIDPTEFISSLGHFSLYRSMDHGDAAATCVLWWAVDSEGNIFCYREYYKEDTLISEHRVTISELSGEEQYLDNLADPSIFNKLIQHQRKRYCVADEYSSDLPGISCPPLYWTPADNSEIGTRNRINEYLMVDPDRLHPITREKGSPRLFFLLHSPRYSNGINFGIRQLRAQRRRRVDERGGRPIFSDDREATIDDHAYDPIRYFMATRPQLGYNPKPFDDKPRFRDLPDMVKKHKEMMKIRARVLGGNRRHRRQRF